MLHLLAADGPAGPAKQPSFLDALASMAPMLLVIWFIWWWLVLRPQKQQQKVREERLGGLKKGDRVRTRGGLVGSVTKVRDEFVVLKDLHDGKGQMTVLKGAIEDLYVEAEKET